MKIEIENLGDMRAFACDFATKLANRGAVLTLRGDLGAGKTTFTQFLANALGVNRPVTSPTFTLVSEYPLESGRKLVHMDLYRLKDNADLEALGFDEYVQSGDIVCIEWPERSEGSYPPGTFDVRIALDPASPDRRTVTVEQL